MSDSVAFIEARFSNLERIGKGSFGDVFKGFDKELRKEVAIKVIDLEEAEDDIEDIQKEISVLSQCRSPYITEYYGSYLYQTKLWKVMEYMAGGSVADLIHSGHPLDETSIACILRDLLHAIEYLHKEGKIHRDIKAANILLTENGDLKVADFGVSAQLTRTISRRKTFVGTLFWMTPEVIQNSDGYNEKADIWSLGITAIEMAKGEPPLADLHPMRLDEHFSQPLKEFVSLYLKKVPSEENKGDRTYRSDGRDFNDSLGTVRVVSVPRDEMPQSRNTVWGFSMGTSEGTGTVRSAVKPLVARDGERKPDASYNPVPPFTPIRGNQGSLSGFPSLSYGMLSSNEHGKDHDKSSEISYTEDVHLPSSNLGPSGTVVVRFSRESLSSSVRFTSSEDTFGTVVFWDQPGEPETGTPGSRLGVQERISSSSSENSAMNLAEAKAALQGGLRKVNVRERSAASKITNKSSVLKNNSGTDRDSQVLSDDKVVKQYQRHVSNGDERGMHTPVISSSPALSLLIIPSLKEAVADDPESSIVSSVVESLMELEHQKPGSCEVRTRRLLQRLGSANESSVKGLNEFSSQIFHKSGSAAQNASDCKMNLKTHESFSLSPLASFLLSRWQGEIMQGLKSV